MALDTYRTGWRLRQKARGLCTECCTPAVPGRSHCQKHLDISRENYQARRAKELERTDLGLCKRCGSPAPTDQTYCTRHAFLRARNVQRAIQCRAQRTVLGFCSHCDSPAMPDRVVCVKHNPASKIGVVMPAYLKNIKFVDR